jgi:PAS domain S-box-containing protein
LEFIKGLFSSEFLPHGTCYLWNPKIVWLHVISDSVITLSYYCIPIALVYLLRKRRDIPFNWIFWMFGLFILGCGTTHLMEVWTVWHPMYLLSGTIKAITAAVSIATAIVLLQLLPKAIALPSADQLYGLNRELERQVDTRDRREQELTRLIQELELRVNKRTAELESINESLEKEIAIGVEAPLRRWAMAGTAVALLATGFMGFLCWRSVVKTAEDADWVTHTQEVRSSLETTLRHVDDIETGTRAFEIRGEDSLLKPYLGGQRAINGDMEAVHLLMADNTSQQSQLATLEAQVNAKVGYSRAMVAERRRTGNWAAPAIFLESDRMMSRVRETVALMDGVERVLLDERTRESLAAQHRTRIVIGFTTLASALFLLFAGLAIRRETKSSAQLRGQLKKINADLEQRVEQRSSALQESFATSERALRELADQKLALDQHAIVAITDVQGTITYVNDKFCAISKYSREELIGHNHRILNSGHHSKEFFQQMYHAIANGKTWHDEIKNRAKDGSIYWVDTTVVPFVGVNGKPRQYVAIRADITERKLVEEALKDSLATSETAFKELADQKFALDQHAIVAITDVQGTITYVNDKFCAISKYPREELIGQNHRLLNSGHHPQEFFREMYRTIANGKVWHDEIKNRAKDGSIYWVDTTIVPFVGAEGKPRQYVAIRADITERKLAGEALALQASELSRQAERRKADEQEIRNLNDELEHRVIERTSQLEAANKELEAFTYSVSHDLRAPLRHIAGFSKMLAEESGVSLPSEAQHYLQRIQDGTRRMGTLVDDLLNLARIGRHELRVQVTGLDSVVKDVIADLAPDLEGRKIEWKIGKLPYVEGDPALLKVVFQNLLSNAVKYTRPRANAIIEVSVDQVAGEQVVCVRDNGVGFNMNYADKLFGVFQRLHRAEDFEGTGVGLATAQRIVQKHGGHIWAQAELDKGAAFYLKFGNTRHESKAAMAGDIA